MSFRWDYRHVYDQQTLDRLEEVFDSVWPIVLDAGLSLGRQDIVRMIVDAHEAGRSPPQIRQHLIYELFRKPQNGR
jgi:hypothetical protein